MEFITSSFRIKESQYRIVNGFGVVYDTTGKEYYLTKSNPITSLISRQVIMGNPLNSYNRESIILFENSINKNYTSCNIKYIVTVIKLGGNERSIIDIEIKKDSPKISIKYGDILIFEGNGSVKNTLPDYLSYKILENKEKHNERIIRPI